MSTEEEEERGLSRSAAKEESPCALEDTVGGGLLSPSRSLSRSLSLLILRFKSSPGPPFADIGPTCPFMWETGALLLSFRGGATGDIRTGGRPYSMLSLSFSSLM